MLGFLLKREREALTLRERALVEAVSAVEMREHTMDAEVGRRVAETLSKMDPFEPLMREFHGVFGEEHERVEDPLDEFGRHAMQIWGYQNADSAPFKRMTEWVMNTQANETLKRAAVTPERILYGRAQISGMILFVKEVKRLAEAYAERLKDPEPFDKSSPVELED